MVPHLPFVSDILLGCQGWNYDAWVGPFYPSGMKAPDYLRTYARAFRTVEVDSTFYAIPPVKTVRGWGARTDAEFVFALKLPQEITHERRLVDASDLVQQFTEVARELGAKLGPILVQMGPDFAPDERAKLAAFLPTLPADLHFAIEFRQRGWITDEVLALLAEHHVALTLSDARWIPREELLACAERPTADFSYVRWMGPDRSIVDYSRLQHDRSAELDAWAAVLPALASRVRRVYGYVNNHYAGHSPANVRMLQERLGQRVIDPASLTEQLGLFA